jgi:hypothetical protein
VGQALRMNSRGFKVLALRSGVTHVVAESVMAKVVDAILQLLVRVKSQTGLSA